jgi:poly(glycerol-phosphate) alpha-glucosyltransferase
MAGSVHSLGPQFGADKEAPFAAAAAFVLSSFSEGLPMVVLEAWSYGLPVLMTRHCNLPEGFRNDAAIEISTDREGITSGLEMLAAMPMSTVVGWDRGARACVMRSIRKDASATRSSLCIGGSLGLGPRPACVLTD